jgi:hypothetical protein
LDFRRTRAKLRFIQIIRKVVAKLKVVHPLGWSPEAMTEYNERLVALRSVETEEERIRMSGLMPPLFLSSAKEGKEYNLFDEASEAHELIEDARNRHLGRVKEPSNTDIHKKVEQTHAAMQRVSERQERMEHGIQQQLEQLTAQISRLANRQVDEAPVRNAGTPRKRAPRKVAKRAGRDAGLPPPGLSLSISAGL